MENKVLIILQSYYKLFIGFIIGIILSGTIVVAKVIFSSSEVEYNNTNSHLLATNVQVALDEIVEKSKGHCPDGYECKEIPKLCKRATLLHTETCSQTSNYCYAAGYRTSGTYITTTITYGSTGTTGTLTSGDAFDCDVNKDGTYDEETERFYYVADMDEDTAVLIYYNNVSGGTASNSTAYAYNSSNINNNGPVTAMLQLPTTEEWKNVSLTNTSRAITNELGGTTTADGDLPTAFSYLGYAARLLTAQEVNSACGITVGNQTVGELDSCNYLMENTKYSNASTGAYGYWLETPRHFGAGNTWRIASSDRKVAPAFANNASNTGVRPVIEVLKSNISY